MPTSPIGSAKPVSDPSTVGFTTLISYHYLRKWSEEDRDYILSGQAKKDGFEMMLDSGAFSAKNIGVEIKLAEYMDFLQEHGKHFDGGYVALDVLGEPKQTSVNLNTMIGEGLAPMPVHVWGDDEKKMDELFEINNKICLGGFKRPHRGSAPKEYVVQKMRWARGRDVHWLGHCRQKHLTSLLPHSCDSVSWNSWAMYGVAQIYLGAGRFQSKQKSERYLNRNTDANWFAVLNELNIKPGDFEKVENWSKDDALSGKVSVFAWFNYVLELRKTFGVRYYLAFCLPWQMLMFRKMLKYGKV
tara:strand:+ start:4219 stop:5118 length:900 start_codon:yes stop_codon:yes gene_type:complete